MVSVAAVSAAELNQDVVGLWVWQQAGQRAEASPSEAAAQSAHQGSRWDVRERGAEESALREWRTGESRNRRRR